ncbi:GumL protein [[Pseudomonas] boreopolis]|uniref:GumL protein n=2 Tax=Xanthomonas boreopolis TaxID=86183 RepID=A0A919F6Y9_9XANT|nr:GumL protein [[Pseudomonas] boreopolis]
MGLLEFLVEKRERQTLFWWKPKIGVNVGDQLSRVVVQAMLGTRDLDLLSPTVTPGKRLTAIGSVLHFARTGDIVWGSGVNGKVPISSHKFKSLDVRSVRGPRTRSFLMERGIDVPQIYGDPGLLFPLFLPSQFIPIGQKRDYVVIPHLNEPIEKYKAFSENLLRPSMRPAHFVHELINAKFVVSSSLHGLILAEAYGVPAIYLDWGNGEDLLKYNDYYEGTGRMVWRKGRSVEECLDIGRGAGDFDLKEIQRGLIKSFPFDMWA